MYVIRRQLQKASQTNSRCLIYFFPDLTINPTFVRGSYFLIPPPTIGPPFAAFAVNSLRALDSSACFFLNSLSVWAVSFRYSGAEVTSSSSTFSFFPCLSGFNLPPTRVSHQTEAQKKNLDGQTRCKHVYLGAQTIVCSPAAVKRMCEVAGRNFRTITTRNSRHIQIRRKNFNSHLNCFSPL